MDWTTIISSLIAALLGGGGIGTLFYWRETKRAKQTENELKLAEGWKKLAEKYEAIVERKDEKIEELYAENGQLRNDKDILSTEVAVLKVYKCIDIACAGRKPPFGYSTEFDPSTAKVEKR